MIKTVLFDLVNTLVRHDPLPETRQQWVLKQFGIDIDPENLRRGFWAANDYFSRESASNSIEKRSEKEKFEVFVEYERTWLKAAGLSASRELVLQIIKTMQQIDPRTVMFDDTLPTLDELRSRGLVVGLVSNLDRTLEQFCPDFDLASHMDFIIISHDIGFEKPHPEIFEIALERAQAQSSEAIMVGDQFYSDIVGALGAGIKPLWLDRDGVFDDHVDCHRIGSLMEITDHI